MTVESTVTLVLFDDGMHNDANASDGIYANTFADTNQIGKYDTSISVIGSLKGSDFQRSTSLSFTISSPDIYFDGDISDAGIDLNANALYDTLSFTIPVDVSEANEYLVTASVYDTNDNFIKLVSSGSVYLPTGPNTLMLEVSAEDIVTHDVNGPYILSDITISDADTGLTIAEADDYTTSTYQLSEFEPLDSDGDGLSDILEQSIGTDPGKIDTDADGATDYQEVAYDGNALSYIVDVDSNPLVKDTDNDGMTDGYEINYGLNPLVDDTTGDLDGDGLTNQQEYNLHTRPDKIDTDDDGRNDKWEVDNSTNPLVYESYVKISGDINLDAAADVVDLALLANQWLSAPGIPSADIAPPGGDGTVNLLDFSILAEHWLEGTP